MKKQQYMPMLRFYWKLAEIMKFDGRLIPGEIIIEAVDLFEEVKSTVSIKNFTRGTANAVHTDTGNIRVICARAASKDLLPYLDDAKARLIMRNILSLSGNGP